MAAEIELATTDELINELFGRFDHVLLIGLKLPGNDECLTRRRWKGNAFTIAGMAQEISIRALDAFDAECSEINPEDF